MIEFGTGVGADFQRFTATDVINGNAVTFVPDSIDLSASSPFNHVVDQDGCELGPNTTCTGDVTAITLFSDNGALHEGEDFMIAFNFDIPFGMTEFTLRQMPGETPQSIPEPGVLALAGSGLLLWGLPALRRRRLRLASKRAA